MKLNDETGSNLNSLFHFLGEIEPNEEFKMMELAELANNENWSFQHPCIMSFGRATFPTDLTPE